MKVAKKKKKKSGTKVKLKSGAEVKIKKAKNKISQSDKVVKLMEKLSKEKGINFDDDRTYNEVHSIEDKTKRALYITAVTDDCPADVLHFGGIDFPKFIQPPVKKKTRRKGAKQQLGARHSMMGRPTVRKRERLTEEQVSLILEKADAHWVPVSIPDYDDVDAFGNPTYKSDRIKATNFLVLIEVDENTADPINLEPIVERSKRAKKLLSKMGEAAEMRQGTQEGNKRVKRIHEGQTTA